VKVPDTKDEKYIPPGVYCYHFVSTDSVHNEILVCPYWERKNKRPEQENGYCHFIEKGDWQDNGTMLLWDMCKECGKKYLNTETAHYWLENGKNFGKKSERKYHKEMTEWIDNISSLLETKEEKERAKKLAENFAKKEKS